MRKLLLVVVLLVGTLLLCRTFLYPYLAVTATVNSTVLVVEGWIPPEQLKDVAQLVKDGGYARIYITGTVRPSAYYLQPDEALDVVLRKPFQGELALNMSGIFGAAFCVVADRDTVLDSPVLPEPQDFSVTVDRPVDQIIVHSYNTEGYGTGGDNVFMRYLEVNGSNIHKFHREIFRVLPDGRSVPATPTFAHQARESLVATGVPEERITLVPAFANGIGRSQANAQAFALRAQQDRITSANLVSLGIHARRSRALYRNSCGDGVRIGIIALPDPTMDPDTWWRTRSGWVLMAKEVLGRSQALVTDEVR